MELSLIRNLNPYAWANTQHPSAKVSQEKSFPLAGFAPAASSFIGARDQCPLQRPAGEHNILTELKVPLYIEGTDGQVTVSEKTLHLKSQFAKLYLPANIGPGTLVILVHHGFFGRSDYLDALNRELSRKHNAIVLAADMAGHGRSGRPPIWDEASQTGFPFHLPQQRAAVLLGWTHFLKTYLSQDCRFLALKNRHGEYPDPFLVGHSQGGGDVLAYFLIYSRTPGIILSNAWYTNRLLLGKASRALPGVAQGILRGLAKPERVLMDLNFTSGRRGREYIRHHPELVRAFSRQMDSDGYFLNLSVAEAGSHWEEIETALENPYFIARLSKTRSAIVSGRFDTRVPSRFARQLGRQTGLPVLEMAGRHFPMLEDPAQFAAFVASTFRGP